MKKAENRLLTRAARKHGHVFAGAYRAANVRRCEGIAQIAGLTGESACPTLVRKSLCFCGAGEGARVATCF